MADYTKAADTQAGTYYRLICDNIGVADWDTMRNGFGRRLNASHITVDCRDTVGDWSFQKSFLKFDLSDIGGSPTFDEARIYFYWGNTRTSAGHICLTAGYQSVPLVVDDWLTHVDTFIELAPRLEIATLNINDWFYFTLDVYGAAWVLLKAGGTMKICLRHSFDVDNDEASATGDGGMWDSQALPGGGYAPYLKLINYEVHGVMDQFIFSGI